MDRVDDKDLGDERRLYRRILPAWIIREDGKCRPQSVALNDRHTHEVSVFVADMTSVSAVMEGLSRPESGRIPGGFTAVMRWDRCQDPRESRSLPSCPLLP